MACYCGGDTEWHVIGVAILNGMLLGWCSSVHVSPCEHMLHVL